MTFYYRRQQGDFVPAPRNIANVDISVSAAIDGTKINPNFGSQDLITLNSLSIGSTPASTGTIRLTGGSVNLLVARNNANSGDIIWLSQDTSNNMSIGTISGNNINLMTGGTMTFFRGGSIVMDYNGTAIRQLLPVQFAASNNSSTGQLRFSNNPSSVLAQRNSGNSADLTLLALNTTDGFVGCDTSFGTSLTNLYLGPTNVVVKSATTSTLATTTTDAVDVMARVQTTTATVTDIYTWTLDNNAVTTVDVRVTACQSNSSNGDVWRGKITYKNAAGTVTLIGTSSVTKDGATAWAVTLDNSTTTARVRVTGAASTTIEWGASISRQVTRQA